MVCRIMADANCPSVIIHDETKQLPFLCTPEIAALTPLGFLLRQDLSPVVLFYLPRAEIQELNQNKRLIKLTTLKQNEKYEI